MRWLVFMAAVFLGGTLSAQLCLSGNSNGRWTIYSPNGHLELPSTIHYLGSFDEIGLAIYAEFDRFGVLNQDGDIRVEAKFLELKSLGNGLFTGINEIGTIWLDLSLGSKDEKPYDNCIQLTNCWYQINTSTGHILLNTQNRREYVLKEGDSLLQAGFGYLYMKTADGDQLFDPKGDTIALGSYRPVFTENYITINTPSYKAVVFRQKMLELPEGSDYFDFLDGNIVYSLEGKVHLLDGESGEEKLSLACDALKPFDREHYLCRKGMNWGLIKKDGRSFISLQYQAVSKSGDYYRVMTKEGTGLLDSMGNQVLPCKYRWISVSGDYFRLTSSIDLNGLQSRKNPSLHLPCQYNDIRIGRNSIKAYTDDYLRIIHFSNDHQVTENVLLENVINVQMRGKNTQGEKMDSRLFDLGWFYENIGQFDKDGYLVGERLKWGLMGSDDTLLLQPRYRQPIFIPQADFSLVSRGKKKHSFYGNPEQEVDVWTPMSHIKGKPLVNELIFSIDTNDLLFRNYSRMYTSKGPAVLMPDNQIMFCEFIEPGDGEVQRFCISSSHTVALAKQNEKESVGLPSWNQNDNPNLSMEAIELNKRSIYVKFPDASWNFLNTDGKQLFAEDFEFAFPFFRETSIVKQNGRWGVVNRDTMLIPTVFSSVERLAQLEDTMFLVRRTPQGIQLYDSAFHAIDPSVTRVLQTSNSLALMECQRDKKVMNHSHDYVSDSAFYQKIISDNYLISKQRKEYILRDFNGKLLGSFILKPIAVVFDQYVLVESRGNFGLLNFFGDTLLDFRFKEIRQNGSFLLAVDNLKNPVYSKELKLLNYAKDMRVLIDPVFDQMAVVKKEKCRIYSSNGDLIGKVSGVDAQLFHNGWLIMVGVNAQARNTSGSKLFFQEIIRNVQGLDEFGFLLEDIKGRFYYYDADFRLLSDSLNLRHARYHGSSCISANCNAQFVLMTPQKMKWLPGGTRVVGTFDKDRLLVKYGASEYYFLNEHLENPYRRKFVNAHPYVGNFASVEEGEGWTIIDRDGVRKSLGAYDEIVPIGNGLFSTSRQALYGLYDSHGNMILPVEFQEISVLRADLIKAVRNGQIEYFDQNGRSIVPVLLTRELTSR